MKHHTKIFAAAVAVALVFSGALFAQITIAPPNAFPITPASVTRISLATMQASPKSVESFLTADRMTSDIDRVVNVLSWSAIDIDNFFAFAGGQGDANNASLKVGFAKKLGGNLLGVYFSGDLLTSNGNHTETHADDFETNHTTTLNDNLAVLFGTPSIGAFRLDVLFNSTGFIANKSDTQGNTGETTRNAPFVTTLQWGHSIALGAMTLQPQVTLGYKWHRYEKTESKQGGTEIVTENWGDMGALPYAGAGHSINDGAIYGKIAARLKFENWTFQPDYAIEIGLEAKSKSETKTGGVTTTTEQTRSGALWHEINLAAWRSWELTDALTFGFKPNIKMKMYSWSNKFTTLTEMSAPGVSAKTETETQTGAFFAFELQPTIDVGVKYQLKPALSVYTGLSVSLFDYMYNDKAAGKDWTEARSRYNLTGLALTTRGGGTSPASLGIGLTIEPADGLGIEVGVTNQGLGVTSGSWDINITQWSGVLAVRYAM